MGFWATEEDLEGRVRAFISATIAGISFLSNQDFILLPLLKWRWVKRLNAENRFESGFVSKWPSPQIPAARSIRLVYCTSQSILRHTYNPDKLRCPIFPQLQLNSWKQHLWGHPNLVYFLASHAFLVLVARFSWMAMVKRLATFN